MLRPHHWSFFTCLMASFLLLLALPVGNACAQPDLDRANELFNAGQFTAAREIYVDIAHQQDLAGQGRSPQQAAVLFNLGSCYAATGDLARASLAFRQSLAVFEGLADADDLDIALALEGLASVLLRQENLEEAQVCIDRALAVRTERYPENHPQLARLYALAATVAQLRGDIAGTEELYYKALMAYRRIHGNVHPIVAEIIQNIGTFYMDNGDFQAEIMFRQAADVASLLYGPGHPLRAVSLANFGRLRWMEGRYAEAEVLLQEALAIHDKLGALPSPALAVCLFQLGKVQLAQEQVETATVTLERAAVVYESAWWRAGVGAERSLAVMSPYPLLAVAQLGLGNYSEALQAFNAHQGRLAILSGHRRDLPAGQGADQNHLLTGEAAVGWLEVEVRPGEHQGWAVVIRPGRDIAWVPLPQTTGRWDSPRELTELALAEIREGFQGEASATDDLRALAAIPLVTQLQTTDRLIVVPSSFMAGFPAELLFGEHREIVYVPYLPRGPRRKVETVGGLDRARVLVVADPPFSQVQHDELAVALPGPSVLRSALGGSRQAIETLPRLVGTRNEAEVLMELFPGTTGLVGDQASEMALRNLADTRQLERFDIIHLATHALIDAELPDRSALVLSQLGRTDDPASDGLLTVQEISSTWQLNAELVTLSACATGLGRRIDGEGFLGFTQSLMGAGAGNILVSLWPVDDQATALLMGRFYGNLAGGSEMTPAAALRQARHWLRDYTTPRGSQPFAAPRYWAGFVMFSRLD